MPVCDLINDRFYLDNDDFRDKFNSNEKDIGGWTIIDLANLVLNSKISNIVYRKNEVKWNIETYNNNMEITESSTANRNGYENGSFNH